MLFQYPFSWCDLTAFKIITIECFCPASSQKKLQRIAGCKAAGCDRGWHTARAEAPDQELRAGAMASHQPKASHGKPCVTMGSHCVKLQWMYKKNPAPFRNPGMNQFPRKCKQTIVSHAGFRPSTVGPPARCPFTVSFLVGRVPLPK